MTSEQPTQTAFADLIERLDDPGFYDCNHHLVMEEAADALRTLAAENERANPIDLRAYELARITSDMLWGGEHGWETATDDQFNALRARLRERLSSRPSIGEEQCR